MMTLRELRLWHWDRATRSRVFQKKHERLASVPDNSYNVQYYTSIANKYRKEADFHTQAVLALNEVVTGDVIDDYKAAMKGVEKT